MLNASCETKKVASQESIVSLTSEESSSCLPSSPYTSESGPNLINFKEASFVEIIEQEDVKNALEKFSLSLESVLTIVVSKKPKLNFLISVGQSYHGKEFQESIFYLISVVQKLRDEFFKKSESPAFPLKVEFLIAGTLQAYNTQAEVLLAEEEINQQVFQVGSEKNTEYWEQLENQWKADAERYASALGLVAGEITFTTWESLREQAETRRSKTKEDLLAYASSDVSSKKGPGEFSKLLIKKIQRYLYNSLSKMGGKFVKDRIFLGVAVGERIYNWTEWEQLPKDKQSEIIIELFQKHYIDGFQSFFKSKNRAGYAQADRVRWEFFPCRDRGDQIEKWKDFIFFMKDLFKKAERAKKDFSFLKKFKDHFESSNYLNPDWPGLNMFLSAVLDGGALSEDDSAFIEAFEEKFWKPFAAQDQLFKKYMEEWAKKRIENSCQIDSEKFFYELSKVCINFKGPAEAKLLDEALVDFLNKKDHCLTDPLLKAFVDYNLEEGCLIYDYCANKDKDFDQCLLYPSAIDPFFRICSGLKLPEGYCFGSMKWIELHKNKPMAFQEYSGLIRCFNDLLEEEKVSDIGQQPAEKKKKYVVETTLVSSGTGASTGGILEYLSIAKASAAAAPAGKAGAGAIPLLLAPKPGAAAAGAAGAAAAGAGLSPVIVIALMTFVGGAIGVGVGYGGYKLYEYLNSPPQKKLNDVKPIGNRKASQSGGSFWGGIRAQIFNNNKYFPGIPKRV